MKGFERIPEGQRPTDARGWEFDGVEWHAPPPVPVTIYDILRKLISGEPWGEEERREAEELITELEVQAALGTLTSMAKTQARGAA